MNKKKWKNWRHRLLKAMVPTLGYSYLSLVGNTAKTREFGHEHHADLRKQYPHFIYVGWHEHLLTGAWVLRRRQVAILVSQSRDGEYLSRMGKLLGFVPVRGSSSRGGVRGLLQLEHALKTGHDVLIGGDGPKGPVKQCKPGAIMLAKHSGMPIIPTAGYISRCMRLKNWDQTIVLSPFTAIIVGYGKPIVVPETIEKADIAHYQQQVKQAIDDLTEQTCQHWHETM